jgi:hypothetical protein
MRVGIQVVFLLCNLYLSVFDLYLETVGESRDESLRLLFFVIFGAFECRWRCMSGLIDKPGLAPKNSLSQDATGTKYVDLQVGGSRRFVS